MSVSPTRAFWLVVCVLIGASLYFTVSVEQRRRSWSAHAGALTPGATVELVEVIDGDELAVRAAGGTFILRLLGIKCFDAKMNDPTVARHGAQCVQTLTDLITKKALTVEFDASAVDERGRRLAYLSAAGVDVGRSMVEQGHAAVYTEFGFSREPDYLAAEREARRRRRGMWRDPRARRRLEALKAEWAARRAR